MVTMKVHAKAGPDGCLRVVVPAVPGVEYEVVLVLAMNPAVPAAVTGGWPPGYLESVVGSIQDESFVAPERSRPLKGEDVG